MQNDKKYILTIAGLDPSSGAGITSDIKTFEAHGLYGLSVCTAITVQNDIKFKQCVWIDINVIISQIETLFDRFDINVVKIGIVQSWEKISLLLDKLLTLNSNVKIILDPIIKATSSKFNFHLESDSSILDRIFEKVYLVTPNYDEIQKLYPKKSIEEAVNTIKSKTNLYLKGGHREDKKGLDALYFDKNIETNLFPIYETVYEKHGSGCVFASSIDSYIALGYAID